MEQELSVTESKSMQEIRSNNQDAAITDAEFVMACREVDLEAREYTVYLERAAAVHEREALARLLAALDQDGTEGTAPLWKALERLNSPLETTTSKRLNKARKAALEARRVAAEARESAMSSALAFIVCARLGLATLADQAEKLRLQHLETQLRASQSCVVAEPPQRAEVNSPTGSPPQEPSPREQRRHPRVRLDCEVDLETESNFFAGFCWDISSGGLFVTVFEPIPVGAEIDVAFTLPGDVRVETRAVVRWTRDVEGFHPSALPGVGLQFTQLTDQQQEAIQRFIQQRQPMFYEA